jgi:hypothetical protein
MTTCPKCGHKFHDTTQQSKAGRASARRLTREERRARAQAAAKARWAKPPQK